MCKSQRLSTVYTLTTRPALSDSLGNGEDAMLMPQQITPTRTAFWMRSKMPIFAMYDSAWAPIGCWDRSP
ncbi:uncharacterized protein ARMOST_06216 [Armillaria ostoyae]|uniref:Uncharacterized protein n=1 Tax=Armillaria ostoyae TaxID=47428 RepID=A0A284R2G0_ARMOS|nr:uncharacterized protein ARMOST_06216 [Armillaria ostoyae]